jgi:hypothetical protein
MLSQGPYKMENKTNLSRSLVETQATVSSLFTDTDALG